MARAQTTSDIFNALGEEQRRNIVRLLHSNEYTVLEIADQLNVTQPQVSKHLNVLKQVNVVNVRKEGRNRYYSLSPSALKPIYDWISPFEVFWNQSLDKLETLLNKDNDERK